MLFRSFYFIASRHYPDVGWINGQFWSKHGKLSSNAVSLPGATAVMFGLSGLAGQSEMRSPKVH